MLVNEYKLYVSIQKSSKDAKFGQCLYLQSPFVMSRTDAQNRLCSIFKINLKFVGRGWFVKKIVLLKYIYSTLKNMHQ
jgi:hypothetical protein